MSDIRALKEQLLERQQQLGIKLDKIKQDVTRVANTDWAEQAQERENDEVMDALGNEVRRELQQVNRALRRIDDGDYEYCSDCGEPIAFARLKVLPFTDFCIDCATKRD